MVEMMTFMTPIVDDYVRDHSGREERDRASHVRYDNQSCLLPPQEEFVTGHTFVMLRIPFHCTCSIGGGGGGVVMDSSIKFPRMNGHQISILELFASLLLLPLPDHCVCLNILLCVCAAYSTFSVRNANKKKGM
mmetsp:Transcript_25849/g.61245  ORF Transcript_25849/g.61245 Transcript_25849/m.61245 type:complete len:134 (-) Transcript_25849:248-649(-)